MKKILLVALIALVSGCEVYKDRALSTGAREAEADHRQCLGRGFEEGTEGHGLCIFELRFWRNYMRGLERRDFMLSVPTASDDSRP